MACFLVVFSINNEKIDRSKLEELCNSSDNLQNMPKMSDRTKHLNRIKVLKEYFHNNFVSMTGLTKADLDQQIYTISHRQFHRVISCEFKKIQAISVSRGVKIIPELEYDTLESIRSIFDAFNFPFFYVTITNTNEIIHIILDKYISLDEEVKELSVRKNRRRYDILNRKKNEMYKFILAYQDELVFKIEKKGSKK